jgi:hypothetical protein
MIEFLPETGKNVLAVKATGKLTKKDYEEVFIPKLDSVLDEYGKIKALLYLSEDFEGWEIGAMWDDAVFGLKHRNDFEKIAVVGGPKWVRWAMKISSHFMKGKTGIYPDSKLREALDWIAE